MSLYDDMDAIKQKSEQVAGWSSGIKLLQSQLQLKKAVQTQPKRDSLRKSGQTLAPVIDLKSKKDDEDSNSNSSFGNYSSKEAKNVQNAAVRDTEWNVEGEYDPMWPNDYEKVVKDLREMREREKEKEEEERRRKNRDDREKRVRERFDSNDERRPKQSGFAGRHDSDEEEEEKPTTPRVGGVAIAPPPSLQESSVPPPPVPVPDLSRMPPGGGGSSFGGGSVAAKIMAKYGFKEGQGLGKQEQGISMALQVEKTSKHGGRIISEKEIMPPPPSGGSPVSASQMQPPPSKPEPSITEIMKSPAKVVLLRNMVGPGEVDDDLEPEVKDECNTKYGDVVRVIIFEQPNVIPEEAVRIFVEFKRIESAIKAVVDLNGRFFGGRQVKAGFYSWEKLNNLQLLD